MKIPEGTKTILCCCTGGKDRSPIMAEYFRGLGYEAKAVGINEYRTRKNGTRWVGMSEMLWANFFVCVSTVHEAYIRGMQNIMGVTLADPDVVRIVDLADHPGAGDPNFRELVLAKMRGAFEK